MPELLMKDGLYHFSGRNPDNDPTWTAFVKYEYELSDECDIEEIDVVAPSENSAYAVTAAALERDYDPGGKIVQLRKNEPGIVYI